MNKYNNPKQLEFNFKTDEEANKDPNILRRIKHYTSSYDGIDLGKEYDNAIAKEDEALAKLGRGNLLERNKDPYIKKLEKFGIENSPKKEPGYPKVSNIPIVKNNINNKPVAKLTNKVPVYKYPTQASPEAFGKLAERVERARQMTGEPKEMSTWDLLKKAADTPEEKKEIRQIIREDYKRNGPKDMDPDDLKWIGKGKSQITYPEINIPSISLTEFKPSGDDPRSKELEARFKKIVRID